jgi:cell division protein FtsB
MTTPAGRPGQPGARPGEPGGRPGQPGARSGHFGRRPAEPGARPGRLGGRLGQLGGRAGQPGGRAGQPGARPGEPDAGPRLPPPERSRLTTRAAVLAVVLCAIALSLAYPVREYIAQRRQISQLETQRQAIAAKLGRLEQQQQELSSNAYVEQQAESRLHMCLPSQTCYVIINRQPPHGKAAQSAPAVSAPWYERLWTSVQQADKAPNR